MEQIRQTNQRWLHFNLAFLFFLSGFASLSYQVVWQRVLTQSIGSDALSAGIVVTSFMIFLGIGAELARQLLTRARESTALLYAAIEIAVGICGVFSIQALRVANQLSAEAKIDSLLIDSGINMLVLALPIIGMGMTTPLMIHLVKGRLEDLGKTSGIFYAANILGASFGAVVTGLVSIELVGLSGTSYIAAFLNVTVGVGIWFVGISKSVASNFDKTPLGERRTESFLIAVMFGFSTLAVQAVFFRILSNFFTLSTVVFPIVLAIYLLLMSAGQVVGGFLADTYQKKLPALVALLAILGITLLALALHFPPSAAAKFGALAFTSFNGSLLPVDAQHLIGDPKPLTIILFSLFFMIAVVPLAALFPVLLRVLTKRAEDAGQEFARLYSAYTIGNVGGIVLTSFFVLPMLGTSGATSITILVTCAGTLLIARRTSGPRKILVAIFLLGIGLAYSIPANYYRGFSLGKYLITDVIEGKNGVATVIPTDRFYTIIDMNRTASASALVRSPEAGALYEAWRWNHSELLAFDKDFRPKNALIIGIGHAFLIHSLLDLPSLEKITVVDISEEVVTAVKRHTKGDVLRVFSDKRVEIIIADGRRFVQKAIAQGRTFDLIQNKINEPWHAGSGNLFTSEFLALEKKLLSPGGYLGVRPLVGHLTDGFRVFGNAVYAPGHFHLFFKNGPAVKPTSLVIEKDIQTAWFAALPDKKESSQREPTIKYVVFEKAPKWEIDENTDDRPTFEYYWTRQTFGRWISPRTHISELDVQDDIIELKVNTP